MARNRSIDELRKRRRYTEIPFSTIVWDAGEQDLSLPETIPDPKPLPKEVVEQFDLSWSLHQALVSLPPRLRLIVQLHCFRHLTFAEIGGLLNMREITARTYFFRALVRMRKVLASKTHWQPSPSAKPEGSPSNQRTWQMLRLPSQNPLTACQRSIILIARNLYMFLASS